MSLLRTLLLLATGLGVVCIAEANHLEKKRLNKL